MTHQIVASAIALAPKVKAVSEECLTANIGREVVVRATMLALVSGRPAFFLGSPGLNKTGTVQDLAGRIDGAHFYDALMPTIVSVEQLLVESTSIEEMPAACGGKSIRTRDTLGRAANAHLFFADEIWKAEPRVLQTCLDLAKGDGVRHEGNLVKTPLLAFIAASNELPDAGDNLSALWSRMTIRAVAESLSVSGKKSLVAARLLRSRAAKTVPQKLSLGEIEVLRSARPHVDIPEGVIDTVLQIYQDLRDAAGEDFAWLWADDRRFGRVFDILQASALLDARDTVNKTDLRSLDLLLWDTPEQIAVVRAKVAPYCRTPLADARELVSALLSPDGIIVEVKGGKRERMLEAITQLESCEQELARLSGEADVGEKPAIEELRKQLDTEKQCVVTAALGGKFKVTK
ncbi:MAG: AAA family ATPase [Minisyncoccia bacterium]